MNDYFKIESCVVEDDEAFFSVILLPDFCGYAGHFPSTPVSPGVCNIQMIKECAELLSDRHLFLTSIDKCKFSAIITPHSTPQLKLRMHLSEAEEAGNMRPHESCKHLSQTEIGSMPFGLQFYEACKVRAALYDETTTYIDFKGEFLILNS